ncbi:phage holin family protein [Roseateles sp. BYS87W]|uniref:Phage holin family protein n=1 Tax=Pelomonas baiyunensis TaxID=3299026 RepID=A0ABW7GZS0_9BURK
MNLDTATPVSEPLRRLGASLITLGRIRLELFAIEAQEEKERIASLLLWAVLGALLAGFGLLMALVLVTVALWDSHRLLALGGGTLLLLAAAALAVQKVRGLIHQPASLFQSSIGELRADADALRPPTNS